MLRIMHRIALAATAALALFSPAQATALVEERGLSEYVRGRHAATNGDLERARGLFENALGFAPSDEPLLEATFEAAILSGDEALAAGAAERLGRIGQHDSAVGTVLFVDALKRGNWARAAEHVDRLGTAGFGSFIAPVLEAWMFAARGDEDRALERLTSGEDSSLPSSYTAEHRGHLAMMERRLRDAAEAYLELLGEDDAGQNWRARILLAEAYQRAGREDYAAETLEAALDAPDVLRARARLAEGKSIDEVPRSPKQAISQLLVRLAADLSRNRNVPLALAFARTAGWADPGNARSFLLSSQLLARAEQYEEALKAAEAIRDDAIYDSLSRAQTASILTALERHEEALAMLEKAAAEPDADAQAYILLGEAYQAAERHDDAVTALRTALTSDISNEDVAWQVWFLVGAAEEQRGDFAAAEDALRQSLAVSPDEAATLNYLGYMLLDRNEKVAEAMGMIERAHELQPANGHITDSLGWAEYRRGEYQKAVETLEKAVSSVPGDPTINDHLGDAYWQVGRRLEARFRWRAALDADPTPEQRALIEDKLSFGMTRLASNDRTVMER
ncbi:hypothetical protein B5C34_13820 [Pacificimonas flava]|uniref:Uncharacterized protein n=2 Tax=Pacificimonas TaxID=1960290 RepID=A0A219B9D2_9SPHN|nr:MULTISPECIES: tetratricopeptide repeat protein [Pacificimonas]MBZ6379903.1 tetratricopeptide repeat protein [Pacificimonas aurantium]OWV34429.1 hypothetical protein B5C34_13820 [Pacificimonas flava]